MKSLLFIIILMMGFCVFPVLAKGEELPTSLDESPTNQLVDETTKSTVLARLFQTPLHFVANHGRFSEEIVYYAKSEGATVYCTEFTLPWSENLIQISTEGANMSRSGGTAYFNR